MIEYNAEFKTVNVLAKKICDICKRESHPGDFEWQEFSSIKYTAGYNSVFGDGTIIEIDICQHCLKDKLDEYIRSKTNSIWEEE